MYLVLIRVGQCSWPVQWDGLFQEMLQLLQDCQDEGGRYERREVGGKGERGRGKRREVGGKGRER